MLGFPTGIVEQAAHRPWPKHDAPWLMTRSWRDLLFAYWPVDRELLLSKVPPTTRREWMCMMRLVGFSTPADALEMPIRRS